MKYAICKHCHAHIKQDHLGDWYDHTGHGEKLHNPRLWKCEPGRWHEPNLRTIHKKWK